MKKLFGFISLIVIIVSLNSLNVVFAIPAKPTPITMQLPDGSTLNVRLTGDEYSHYYTSIDNYLLLQDKNGYFYYADTSTNNKIQPSLIKARDIDQRTIAEKNFLAGIDKTALLSAWQSQNNQLTKRMKPRKIKQKATYPTTGMQKGLVILVEYTDNSFTITNPKDAFHNLLNEENYSDNNATGSARDYFIESSKSQFQPEFDVYGPVKLAHPMSYYGGNDYSGSDKAPEEMAIEACQLLDDEIDFTEYDRDNDGQIDNVYIFYAGYGEANGGSANTVWPHSWDIYEGAGKTIVLDGVRLNHYACSNELNPDDRIDGIGTFCHEFSHVLGLPDLYSTQYTNSFTPGSWSLMDQGSYNNDSRTPPYLSIYERYALGWITPKEIGDPEDIQLENISKNKGYIIKTDKENEYYLLENRQQTSWDAYIPGHGMLIWHIDYNQYVWNMNIVNNTPSHQYVDIVEADGTQSERDRRSDVFPGTKNVTSFTDETTPAMKTWSGTKLNKPITDIEERNGVIYFKMSGGKINLPPVKALPAMEITPGSFIAQWEKSDLATEYILDVYTSHESTSGKITISYADGYKGKKVNGLSCLVENLTPETRYCYVVRASDGTNESISSNEVCAVTLKPTFEYLCPTAKEATTITASSFETQWESLEGAQKYILSVYSKVLGEPNTLTIDFTGGIGQLADGWETNCKSTYGSADYSGKAAPSLRFNENFNYIESPVLEDGIRELRFWYRGVNASENNKIIISGFINRSWVGLDTLSLENTDNGFIAEWKEKENNTTSPSCKAIRISYEMIDKGSLAIDDITLVYGGAVSIVNLPGYEEKDVENVLSWKVDKLKSDKEYFYTVKAFNGEVYSKVSNEVNVRTLSGGSGIKTMSNDKIKVYVQGSDLIITSEEPDDIPGCIMNAQGCILKQISIATGTHRIPILEKGIYLVKAGTAIYKIMR